MSRYTDIIATTSRVHRTELPAITWSKIGGQTAPIPLTHPYSGPNAPLPKADIVILTWTSAEWLALDHVFLNGGTPNIPAAKTLESQWHLYSQGAPASSAENRLWGYYQLVSVQGNGRKFTVLLFKSDSHLAHPPWITGLATLVSAILAEAKPERIYSIGTAGGANNTEKLGDVVITNAAHLQVTVKDNTGINYNNQTFACTNWFPATDLLSAVQTGLFFPLSQVVNPTSLAAALQDAAADYTKQTKLAFSFTLNDLLNGALENLNSPRAIPLSGVPLLTTDNYYIAPGNTPYAALEMDDAVIAHVAAQKNVDFVFVRNISDTLVPAQTAGGQAIPAEARDSWSSAIYDRFGLYTSFNGALATWATIAAAKS